MRKKKSAAERMLKGLNKGTSARKMSRSLNIGIAAKDMLKGSDEFARNIKNKVK